MKTRPLGITRAAMIAGLCCSVAGCAASMFGKEREVGYESMGRSLDSKLPVLLESEQRRVYLESNCGGGYIITGMLSPIIPLPPVIPVWFLNSDRSQFDLLLRGEGFSYVDPKIVVTLNGQQVGSRVVGTFGAGDVIRLSFESAPCLQLNGATLAFSGPMYDGKTIEIPAVTVFVKEGGYKFDFGYLRQ